jgi:hypothetical protein
MIDAARLATDGSSRFHPHPTASSSAGPPLGAVLECLAGGISAAAGTVARFVPAIANVEQNASPFLCPQGEEREIAIAHTSQERPYPAGRSPNA